MKQAELKQILDAHAEWLQDNSKGQRADLSRANLLRADLSGANLSGANLSGADLTGAYLSGAYLSRADLTGADLTRAYLSGADLTGADLTRANLLGAYLSRADLSGANLSRAYLTGADLTRAYLSRANLSGANLSGANLSDANLLGAYLSRANLSPHSLVPEEGEFIAFKKLKDGKVAKLLIPAYAKRVSSLVGRKCRASHALVLEITYNGVPYPDGEGVSSHNYRFKYKVGETVRANLNDDIRVECASGIHFFITRKEAENY